MNLLDRLDTTLRVHGCLRLEGSVDTHGAKNAALPIMAAALMAKGKVTLHRVPRITDVSVMWSLLEALGARLSLDGPNTTPRPGPRGLSKAPALLYCCAPALNSISSIFVPSTAMASRRATLPSTRIVVKFSMLATFTVMPSGGLATS